MEFFNSAIEVLQTLVVALGAGLGVWGAINLLEGYGNDNPGSKSHGSFPFSLQRPSGRTVFAYIAKRGLTAIVYVTKNFGFRRGEIYFADLDPHYGSEQGGKRPVIIIQNDVGNKFAPTVIVAAVTSRISKKPNQPTHVLIDKNPAFSRPSVVLLEQIFTIDKERINNFMGLTSEWEMKQIEEALLKSLGINK